MQFFNLSTIVAAILSAAAVAKAANWETPEAQACALRTWSAIKMSVDPHIKETWPFLPPPIKATLAQANVLNADQTLIVNPTYAQIALIARTLPNGIFSPYADTIVDRCLAQPASSTTTSVAPPTSTTTRATTTATSHATSTSVAPPTSTTTRVTTTATSHATSTTVAPPVTSTTAAPPVTSTTAAPPVTSTTVAPTSSVIKCIPRPHY
ncbi:hypothetical protein GGI04_002885 [Coemansia thaxteri]|uniref:Uncharacterized protein n=1 Tax=Coemansia thaxteri TaxID=2663907 RepID=A0A9W8EKE5_9FUNG|nr:hypothetical protein GGI04_002885 [Coemansia thaxteri]KAJ2006167.1 hypothetical protein H4R26_001541 [Coemansia thaxteri]KAJ2471567.1 hypothetical protein GGI02_002182 [Coemansia sp. RSA 2322]KAJ2485722.1 hypothetical protein EV174_001548 [Coemansia sp. RSA 2320]